MGIGLGAMHSPAIAALLWFAFAGGFYTIARTIYGSITARRETQLRELIDRLQQQVESLIVQPPPQVGASAARSLAAGDGGTTAGG